MKTQWVTTRDLRWTTGWVMCGLFVGGLSFAPRAWAQTAEADESADVDDAELKPEVKDYSEQRPTPPGGTALDRDGETRDMSAPPIVAGAGMGSRVAYAERGVVELGGTLGLDVRDEIVDFSVAPTLGYFIIDRLELTLIPLVSVRSISDDRTGRRETNTRWALIAEPTYHLPLMDYLYGFVGGGIGFTYESGPGVEALLRPVLGLDIMLGRSGVLKPGAFLDIGLGDGAIGGGFQMSYTVML
jgi:hypothetical protein